MKDFFTRISKQVLHFEICDLKKSKIEFKVVPIWVGHPVCVSVITAFLFRIYQNAMDQNIYTVCGGCVKFARDKYNFKVEIILAHAYSRMLFYDVLKPRLSSCTMLLCRTTIDLCVKKDTTFRVGYFTTISVHFFANYIYIFHKT